MTQCQVLWLSGDLVAWLQIFEFGNKVVNGLRLLGVIAFDGLADALQLGRQCWEIITRAYCYVEVGVMVRNVVRVAVHEEYFTSK